MSREIERKFHVVSDDWKASIASSHQLRDAAIPFGNGKVRLRVSDQRAWITFKGPRSGIARDEYEYEIPRDDGEHILRELQPEDVIRKTRHCVPHAGVLWSVDVHEFPQCGLVTAEVELLHEDQSIALPRWVGRELTSRNSIDQQTSVFAF